MVELGNQMLRPQVPGSLHAGHYLLRACPPAVLNLPVSFVLCRVRDRRGKERQGLEVGDELLRRFCIRLLTTLTPPTLHPTPHTAPTWMPRRASRTLIAIAALAAAFLNLFIIVQAAAFVCPLALPPHLRPPGTRRLLPTPTISMASSTPNQANQQQQQQQHIVATLHPNRVLELQLIRAKALNALSSHMLLELTKHVQRALANDKDDKGNELIEAVLLTAVEGSRAFSAGGDIKEILGKLLSEKTEAVTQGKRE